ncbi:hypothetical protein RJ639_018643 [Escallonia herrerae]|uniref:Uncharacterized protein n=1 Tax=Escallonia herrerae TaxID=1293975 RepID=A0AA88VB94_9ASTE|nr:hypothetical protein RJ639_018643 [Escallonia herrerae]
MELLDASVAFLSQCGTVSSVIFLECNIARSGTLEIFAYNNRQHSNQLEHTTLDLSQKAEKGMLCTVFSFPFYTVSLGLPPLPQCGIIEHIQPDAIVFVFSERINYNHFSDIRDIFCCTGMLAVNLESILEGAARTQAPTTTNYDVGSTTWVDLRRAPLQSAMECNTKAKHKEPVSNFREPSPQKINLISCKPLAHISDIKLIRTDTTLDLSQKAEKGTP